MTPPRSKSDRSRALSSPYGLTFIDTSGLTALLEVRGLVVSHGGHLILHGVRPLLGRLLAITALGSQFEAEGDVTPSRADGSVVPGGV